MFEACDGFPLFVYSWKKVDSGIDQLHMPFPSWESRMGFFQMYRWTSIDYTSFWSFKPITLKIIIATVILKPGIKSPLLQSKQSLKTNIDN